jgi:Retroviral aspartyl protease
MIKLKEIIHEEVLEEQKPIKLEEAYVSMHATSQTFSYNIMKFKGYIGETPICALLDSRSTHSFINPLALTANTCEIKDTHLMVVMVANREKIITDSKCASLNFSIQGFDFAHELRLLLVKGYDMILGLDWLSQFGPMTIDWQQKWVEFKQGDRLIRLEVKGEQAVIQQYECIKVAKESKSQSEVMLAHIWLCVATDKSE